MKDDGDEHTALPFSYSTADTVAAASARMHRAQHQSMTVMPSPAASMAANPISVVEPTHGPPREGAGSSYRCSCTGNDAEEGARSQKRASISSRLMPPPAQFVLQPGLYMLLVRRHVTEHVIGS